MSARLMESTHLVKGIDPVADAFATGSSQAVNLANWYRARFICHWGIGATGTSTVTVEACLTAAGGTPVAIPFLYRLCTTGDTEGAITAAASTGVVTTAGSSQIFQAEVDASALANVAGSPSYVRITFVDVVDSPNLGGVLIELSEPRYRPAIAATVIT